MNAWHRHGAIVSSGDEIVLGQTLDTNSQWLSAQLVERGIIPVEHVSVPDERAALVGTLRRLAQTVDVIVVSGGLGPTSDDLTREALAEAADDVLVEDAESLEQIEAWFRARGRPLARLNRVQALRPSRARAIQNLNGTAPGIVQSLSTPGGHTCDVFCLPGPPGEMMPMFKRDVVPALRIDPNRSVRTRVLHTFGLGESDLAARLGPLMDRGRMPLVGTTASKGVVSCRLRYEGSLPGPEAEKLLQETEDAVRAAAGPYVFGAGAETLPSTVVAALRSRGETLAVVESCTGGLLAAAITDVPGCSDVFPGGLITYSNASKKALAHVNEMAFLESGPGAVSRETALALAHGGLEALGSAHALSITGIAGPGGAVPARVDSDGVNHPEKPVGTVWIARAARDGSSDVRRFRFPGDRGAVREWSVRSALAMLWQHLSNTGLRPLPRQVEPPA